MKLLPTVLASTLLLAGILGCGACSSSSSNASGGAAPGLDAGAAGDDAAADAAPASAFDVVVHAVVDLPRSADTEGLSATAFDEATRTLFAIQDTRPSIVPLVGSADFTSFTVGTPIPLTGRTETAWDGEGLVREGGGFIAVTRETGPTVERFDASGARTAVVTTPAHFTQQASNNKGLESLTLSPSGRFLFTANESALTIDGLPATKTRGTTVRILRRELATNTDVEVAYRTEPLGAGGASGDMGVSDLSALDDTHLLVLERGFQAGFGNTVRVFRVDFASGANVEGVPSFSDTTPALAKTLVVDVSALPPGGATHPGVEPNPLLDNYEGLALGPTLASGRRLLFVISDDNQQASQVPRVLVLGVLGL
jgi:hypothetical protein